MWELAHIGWFQEYWVARNPQRDLGIACRPEVQRLPGVRADADRLYDSSQVPHDSRWALPLPDALATRRDLEAQLATTLDALEHAGDTDDELYFFRLALFHEDMHHEAALCMAQALGVPIDDSRWQLPPHPQRSETITIEGGPGFAFDNELQPHEVRLAGYWIDSQVVRWREYLPFVEAGGYSDRRWWTPEGWRHIEAKEAPAPAFVMRKPGGWQQWRFGSLSTLDLDAPACHLSCHEAAAWCRWSGRRLPTEFEWETAALDAGDAFHWGRVWEWSASPFAAYPGFEPHPYRDYSAPWFDARPVLRGASFATQPRLHDPRYRNFFLPGRTDIFAGFRTCEV
ncbi:MAG TPA: selenoneine synthase SenA [Burkholderiaceae bacterium]|nr:selenoneine synthase SenA [Burkholderiaceae bacterium]